MKAKGLAVAGMAREVLGGPAEMAREKIAAII
jgi:hypothetical protein